MVSQYAQPPPYVSTGLQQFPSMECGQQVIDFSSPSSQDHHEYTEDALDLCVHSRKDEAVVKQDCCTPPPDIVMNHAEPSTSALNPYIQYSHIQPAGNIINPHSQTFFQSSNPTPPPQVPDIYPVQPPCYMPMHSIAIPSTSRDFQPVPPFPQYMPYLRTPSYDDPSVTAPGNSSSNCSLPALSPSPLRLQLQPFQMTGNDLPGIPIPAGNPAKKFSRPFKALPLNLEEPSVVMSESYTEFRQKVLNCLQMAKRSSENKKSAPVPKHTPSPQPSSSTEGTLSNGRDAAYLLKRKKNNAAAKRSRDLRRAKEDELAIRVSYLEQQNRELKYLLVQQQHWKYQVLCRNCRRKAI
jgi:hypothetical protein